MFEKQQSGVRFDLESLEPRLLLSADVPVALATASMAVSTDHSQEVHRLDDSVPSQKSADIAYDPASQIDSIFQGADLPLKPLSSSSENSPLASSAETSAAAVDASKADEKGSESDAPKTSSDSAAQQAVEGHKSDLGTTPVQPGNDPDAAVPEDPLISTLRDQLAETQRIGLSPPDSATASASVSSVILSLGSDLSLQEVGSGAFPQLPPPGTALTKVSAFRNGLTALLAALNSNLTKAAFTQNFPLLVSSTFASLINASGLHTALQTDFFTRLDTFLRDTVGPTDESFQAFINSLSAVVAGSLNLNNVGTKISYDLHLKLTRSTTVNLSQLANFPDAGVNSQTIQGTAPVNVTLDMLLTFGVDQNAPLTDAQAFFFTVGNLEYHVDTDGTALVNVTGAAPTDPKGSLIMDTALRVQFNAPSGSAPFAKLSDLQGAGASALWGPQAPTGSIVSDMPLPNAFSIGGSIVRFVGGKSIGFRAPDAFGSAGEDILSLNGEVTFGDLVTVIGSLALRRLPSAAPTTADLVAPVTKIPLTGVKIFVGTGWGTATPQGILLSSGEGGLVLANGGIAMDVQGDVTSMGLSDFLLRGQVHIRINTTNSRVDEAIPPFEFLSILGSTAPAARVKFDNGDRVTFVEGRMQLTVGSYFVLNGDFSFKAVLEGVAPNKTFRLDVAVKNFELFVGAGQGTDTAIGFKVSEGTLGLLLRRTPDGQTKMALDAFGRVSLVGIDKLYFNGSAHVRFNTMGLVNEPIEVPGNAPMNIVFTAPDQQGTVANPYVCVAGTMLFDLNYLGLVQIGGDLAIERFVTLGSTSSTTNSSETLSLNPLVFDTGFGDIAVGDRLYLQLKQNIIDEVTRLRGDGYQVLGISAAVNGSISQVGGPRFENFDNRTRTFNLSQHRRDNVRALAAQLSTDLTASLGGPFSVTFTEGELQRGGMDRESQNANFSDVQMQVRKTAAQRTETITYRVAARDVTVFLGDGTMTVTRTPGGDATIQFPTDAKGVKVEHGSLALLLEITPANAATSTPAKHKYALDARGSAALIGFPEITLQTDLRVRLNTLGLNPSGSGFRLFTDPFTLCGTLSTVTVDPDVDQGGTLENPFVRVDARVKLNLFDFVQATGVVSFQKFTENNDASAETHEITSYRQGVTDITLSIPKVLFPIGVSSIVSSYDPAYVSSTDPNLGDLAAYLRYQTLLNNIRQRINEVEAASSGAKVTIIKAVVNGSISSFGGAYANRDRETHQDDLSENRRDHVLALASALSHDLGVDVQLEGGTTNGGGHATSDDQNANFTEVRFTTKKAAPGKTTILIGAAQVSAFAGYVVGDFQTAPDNNKIGVELTGGKFGMMLVIDPTAPSTASKKLAFHAEGTVNLKFGVPQIQLVSGGHVTLDVNTIRDGVDQDVDVQDPITGVKLATIKLFYVESLQRATVEATLGINGFSLSGRFLIERFDPEDRLSPIDLRSQSGALLVRFFPAGGPPQFMALSGFDVSTAGVQDWVVQLKRIADWIDAMRGSSFFNTQIPLTGKTLGELFDIAQNYLQDFYSQVIWTELEGTGAVSADVLNHGRLSRDVSFYLLVNGAATPKKVTITAASTTDNDTVSAGQTPFDKLAEDVNAAINAAFTGTEFAGFLHAYIRTTQVTDRTGALVPLRTLSIANVPGKLVNRIRLTRSGPSDETFKDLGYSDEQEAVEHPQPNTERALLDYISSHVPGASSVRQLLGLALTPGDVYATDLHFGWTKTLTAHFGDSLSFLDGFGNLSGSGDIQLTATINLSTTLGVDLTPVETPKLRNAVLVPPPSNGRITKDANFTVLLSPDRDSAPGTGARYTVTLTQAATAGNSSVQELADDLNAAFVLATNSSVPSDRLSQHLRAVVVGNSLVLAVKDSELGVINALEVQASADNTAVTEIGMATGFKAQSKVKGLFFQGLALNGSITVSASNLNFSARLGGNEGIIAFSSTGGSITGQLGVSLSLFDPGNTSSTRVYVGSLVTDLGRVGAYIRPSLTTTAAIDATLPNLTITTPGFGNLIDPDDNTLRIYIPDITDLHVNSTPFNATTNNKGIFITLPEFAALNHFNCLSVVDILSGLTHLGAQLEGIRGFEFLRDPLPGVGVSLGQILDAGSKLLTAVSDILHGDASTLAQLEHGLENLLGLPDDSLVFALDHVANPTLDNTHRSVVFDPQGRNNGIRFDAVVPSGTFDKLRVKFEDDGRYASGLDRAEANYDESRRVLTIHYNATFTKAQTIVAAVNQLISAAGPRAPPVHVSLDATTGGDGTGTVSQTALRAELSFNAVFTQNLPFYVRLADYVARLPDATFGPVKQLLGGLAEMVSIEASGNVSIALSATFRLSLGLDISNPCRPMPFLYDSEYAGPNTGTGIFLQAAVRGTNLNFKAGGLLGLSIRNGSMTFDADGDPTTAGPNDNASVSLQLKDRNGSGRHYFFRDTLFDLSNFDLKLQAGFSVVLPVYGPGGIALGATSDGNGDGFADNSLALLVPNLSQLLQGNATGVRFAAPDIASLFRALDVCEMIRKTPVLLDGLDELLGSIENGLRTRVLNQNLPLVGDKLASAAQFISDFRNGLLASLRQKLAEAGDPIGLLKKAIFDVLGPAGLDMLVKVNADGQLVDAGGAVITPDDGAYLTRVVPITDFNDVQITCVGDNVDFKIRLLKRADLVDTSANPIRFDIGIPGFGLSVDGNVRVTLGFDLKLYFGIGLSQGFYFRTDVRPAGGGAIAEDELRVFFSVSIPGMHAKGQLFFLQLDVSDETDGVDAKGKPRDVTVFSGYFIVDIKDPAGNDGKLTIDDLRRPGLSLGDVITARLGAKAEVHLDLAISFGGDTAFPRLLAEFDLSWKFEVGKPVETPSIAINNIQLDVGTFISNLIGPILTEIKKVTGPLQPVVDFLNAPIPILSDLAGRPFNMLDLAEVFGYLTPSSRKFVEAILTIIDVANNIPITASGSILIPLGSIAITQNQRGASQSAPKPGTGSSNQSPSDHVGSSGPLGPISAFFKKLEKIGIKFPILDISAIAQLFMGKPVSIIEYHMPLLELKASFKQTIQIFGPFAVFFGGEIGVRVDLTFGYDTYGLQKFFASSDKDPLVIFDGFFVKDVDDKNVDIPEVTVFGGLFIGGGVNVVIAEAGVKGGIYAEIKFNLNDPDGDGRVRVSEIIANAKKDIRCIFDISGEVYAEASLFLTLHFFFFDVNMEWKFLRITILKFEITCPTPVLAHFTDGPALGSNNFDGRGGSGKLILHMGKYASLRAVDDTADGDEIFILKSVEGDPGSPDGETVEVSFNGVKQTFYGVKSVVADAGEGNDTLDLKDLLSPAGTAGAPDGRGNELDGIFGGNGNDLILASQGAGGRYHGGEGNDTITAPEGSLVDYEFHGDGGDDTLTGQGGADRLFGEDGADKLYGRLGPDHIFGGLGNDSLFGEDGDDELEGNEGRDHIEAGAGDDSALGGADDDEIYGGAGNDRLVGNAGGDLIDGGEGDDVIVGDEGVISVGLSPVRVTGIDGIGNDILIGAGGADVIFGCDGNDTIFGGARIIGGSLTPVALDGVDFIDGGNGDDQIYADDAGGAGQESFPGATVAGVTWIDLIRNNVFDVTEHGVSGVRVELHNAADDSIAGVTYTSSTGAYRFDGLRAGAYYVKFQVPNVTDIDGNPVTSPLVFVTADQGADDTIDSDANTGTGKTATVTLGEGESALEVDAGFVSTALQINIDNPSVKEGNSGFTDLIFTISFSQPVNEQVLVCYKSLDGTAVEDADYQGVDWTLAFNPGETSKTVTIRVRGDNIDEGDSETMQLQICDVVRGLGRENIVLTRSVATGTIIDDDAPPVVSVLDGRQTGTHESDPLSFVIRLSNPSSRPITVLYQTNQIVGPDGALLSDSATQGKDYTHIAGSVTFNPMETEKVIVVNTLSDTLDEYDEVVGLSVELPYATPASLATLGDDQATARIIDDDATPFLRITPSATSVLEGQAGHSPVTLKIGLYDPVTNLLVESGRFVDASWSTSSGTATVVGSDTDYQDVVYKFERIRFAPGEKEKTITVEVIGDQIAEPDEVFYVNLLTADNAILDPTDRTTNHAAITIRNDESGDPGPWYVQFDRGHYEVSEGGAVTFTVVRAPGSSDPDAVLWISFATAVRGLAPGAGIDYQTDLNLQGPRQRMLISFADGENEKTFTINAFTDNLYEGDEVVVMNLANPTGGPVRAPQSQATVVIKDLQSAPMFRVVDTTTDENSPGFAFVTITAELPDDVTLGAGVVSSVRWQTRDGTAKAGAPDLDYVAADHPAVAVDLEAVLFTAANFGGPDGNLLPQIASKIIRIRINDDAVPEPVENFRVLLTEANNATIDRATGVVTIRDNDRVSVNGFIFQDLNRNGRYDSDVDSRLPGVIVTVTDSSGVAQTLSPTDSNGVWTANVLTGAVKVEVKDIGSVLVGGENTTRNNPLNANVDYLTTSLREIGFGVTPKVVNNPASTGSGLIFNDDTVYGGPGNDRIDAGAGDDWIVGGHWLGPGCACSGKPYDAEILRVVSGGSAPRVLRTLVNPDTLPGLGIISGRVWSDFVNPVGTLTNGNGRRDGSETGVGGVQVNLYDDQWTLVGTRFTDANGVYRFEKLAACNYVVQFILPDGNRFTVGSASGVPTTVNSDANAATGFTSILTVAPNVEIANVDAGLIPVPVTGVGPWNVSFSKSVFSARETDAQAVIKFLHALGSTDGDADFFTRDGTAIAGVDYDPAKVVLSFADDQASASAVINLRNPGPKGTPRIVVLVLKNPTGGAVKGAIPLAALVILDEGCLDNDTIYGREGNDLILGDYGLFRRNADGSAQVIDLGGMGDDVIYGNEGRDEIHAQGGKDRIDGGRGDDILDGGSEDDTYVFNGDRDGGGTRPEDRDSDTLIEQSLPLGGFDTIDLSSTSSFSIVLDLSRSDTQDVTPALRLTLPAGGLIERIVGGRRNDILRGTAVDDVLDGGEGDDLLEGRGGNDLLIGGLGSDVYVFDADSNLGQDEIRETASPATENDRDRLDFSSTTTIGVQVDLNLTTLQTVNSRLSLLLSDSLGIEELYGSSQNDILVGNARPNVLWGREGNDQLDGGSGGYDILKEERAGNWQLSAGVLKLLNTGETDTFNNGSFDEIGLVGDDNANQLDASSFNGRVTLDGRGGDDVLKGGSGTNLFHGGRGNDTIVGGPGIDILEEEADGDFVLAPGSLQFVPVGGGATETDVLVSMDEVHLTGGSGNNRIDGSAFGGKLVLDGRGGNDRLLGGSADDVLIGGAGDDTLQGGPGNDRYVLDADQALGNDTITELAGGGDQDTLDFSATTDLGIRVDLALLTPQTITDGELSSLTLTQAFVENVIGTDKADVIRGNDLVNHLEGRGGDDVLTGRRGDDVLDGGAGFADKIDESVAVDATLITNVGDPTRSNLVFAAVAAVPTDGSSEVDLLLGVESALLRGSAVANRLDARPFLGTVELIGGDGDDVLRGGVLNDILEGGRGNDVLQGGDGNDVYRINADIDLGSDRLDEDPHFVFLLNSSVDTLDFSATHSAPLRVDLGSALIQVVAPGVQIQLRGELTLPTVPNFENVIGGDANDVLIGNSLSNVMEGRGGNDVLVDAGVAATATTDLFIGGDGNDSYTLINTSVHTVRILEAIGTGGVDTLDFSGMTASLFVDLSNGKPRHVESSNRLTLELIGCQGLENVIGTALSDDIRGNSNDNQLNGRGGNDSLYGDRGNDLLIGEGGNDRLAGGRGDDTYQYIGNVSLGIDTLVEEADQGVDVVDLTGFATGGATLNLGLAGVNQNIGSGTRIVLDRANTVETALYPPTGPPPVVANIDEWVVNDQALSTRLVSGRSVSSFPQFSSLSLSGLVAFRKPVLAETAVTSILPPRAVSVDMILGASSSVEDGDPLSWIGSTTWKRADTRLVGGVS